MPLSIRPFMASDGPQLLERFAVDSRPPWLRLPHPYSVERLLDPAEKLDIFVATSSPERVVGLLAFDRNRPEPLMIGPLAADEQLADLYVRALLAHGLSWAREVGLEKLQVKIDLGEERALAFFLNQGFQVLESREYVLAAKASRRPVPTPVEGIRFGPSPEMLSSDYLRLYQEIGGPVGWTERLSWTRPQVFAHLQTPGVQLHSARAGDTYLGFAELSVDEDNSAQLVLFGLLPSFRRRGVGGAFMEHLLYHAFEQLSLERIWLEVVADDDKGVLPFFRQHWFKQERALVTLEKSLDPAHPTGPASSPQFNVADA